MLDDVWFVTKDFAVWLRRRTFLLLYCCLSSLMVPFMFAKAIIDHHRGKGWFSDPLGKPRLFQYGRGLMEFVLASIFLRTKPATEEAYEASKNSSTRGAGDGISVQLMDDYLEFQPAESTGGGNAGKVGVIIIPGAFVSPFAYSIVARSLAHKGHPSFVLRLPFDLAFYGWATAGRIIKRRQEGQPTPPAKWVLVGHSLGAMGAELFTEARPECVNGIVFLGSTRMRGNLKKLDMPSLVIAGSRDPFTPPEEVKTSTKKLPEGAETHIVEGGNHRGFASYHHQPLDWEATITPEEQRTMVVDAITDFIKRKVA